MDSTDIIWPVGLPVPLQGAKQGFRNHSIQTQMDSGRIRSRRIALDPREMVEVVWRFTADQYSTFETFFKNTLQNGDFAFSLPLFGSGGLVNRKVSFVDGTYRFDRSDNLFIVTATLEALESETYI